MTVDWNGGARLHDGGPFRPLRAGAGTGVPLLVIEGVRKEYFSGGRTVRVLDGASFRLAAGEAVAVTGPSGSGKSTLLNIIGALDRPDAGTVAADGRDVTTLGGDAAAEYRRRFVGFVFQDHHLLPQCTVLE
ncbi:MAG: ATP-binding cassette domain-containing protein, partial [Planctomycetota bacterium]|nr:ATP-binding cassette domain-containing protein [Planctomycetota bacterium]